MNRIPLAICIGDVIVASLIVDCCDIAACTVMKRRRRIFAKRPLRECLNRKALAFLRLASIRLMLRKLCQKRA